MASSARDTLRGPVRRVSHAGSRRHVGCFETGSSGRCHEKRPLSDRHPRPGRDGCQIPRGVSSTCTHDTPLGIKPIQMFEGDRIPLAFGAPITVPASRSVSRRNIPMGVSVEPDGRSSDRDQRGGGCRNDPRPPVRCAHGQCATAIAKYTNFPAHFGAGGVRGPRRRELRSRCDACRASPWRVRPLPCSASPTGRALRSAPIRPSSARFGLRSWRTPPPRLGVDHVELFDYPDGALDREPIDRLAKHVYQVADRVRPDLLLVFDEGGITGHPDHGRVTEVAVAYARDTRLPVLAWAVAEPVATTLNEELGTTFVGRTPEDLDFEVHVDRGGQCRAIIRHTSQATDNPVLLRRLEVQGDREVLRWLVAPSEAPPSARNGLSPLSDQDNDQEG